MIQMDEFVNSVRELVKSLEEFSPMPESKWGKMLSKLKEHLAEFDNYDPTPWCTWCGAMKSEQCNCGPRAEND